MTHNQDYINISFLCVVLISATILEGFIPNSSYVMHVGYGFLTGVALLYWVYITILKVTE